jgi:hypothetical protein
VLAEAASQRAPSLLYFKFLFELFKDLSDELDEERIVKSATGIRNTTVWKKLFKFQRDGAVGAIDKLERIGGCITWRASRATLGQSTEFALECADPAVGGRRSFARSATAGPKGICYHPQQAPPGSNLERFQ